MFGFELKVFEPGHVSFELIRDRERDIFRGLGQAEKRLQAMSELGPAWSIFKDGGHVSSGGLIPVFPHVADVWQLPSKDVSQHTLSYGKFYRAILKNIFETLPYTRLQTVTAIDDLHRRWMTFIGFEIEGILRGHGLNGEDQYQWARLKNGH